MKLQKSHKILLILVFLLGVFVIVSGYFQLRINTSSSMPLGVYRVVKKPLAVGNLIEVCLPEPIAKMGLSRSYVMGGLCKGGAAPVIKQLVAMQGDDINLQTKGVSINGKLLAHSQIRAHDQKGRVLIIFGSHFILQTNELWLYGNHDVNSWDSRYFGPITANYVSAVLLPVFTFH
jgi:conjugative transfer signal peptidase TraF